MDILGVDIVRRLQAIQIFKQKTENGGWGSCPYFIIDVKIFEEY